MGPKCDLKELIAQLFRWILMWDYWIVFYSIVQFSLWVCDKFLLEFVIALYTDKQ